MELYILLCLAAIIVVLEIIILAGSRKSGKSDGLEQNFRHMEGYVADEFQRNRKETADSLKDMNQLIREMQQMNVRQSDKLNVTLTENVSKLQQSNEKKLEEMRLTVDEKLTDTLSKRLEQL